MPLIDFASAVKPEVLFKPANYAVGQYDPDSSLTYGFDSRGSYAAVIEVNCGSLVFSGTLTLLLVESADGTTWTDLIQEDGERAAFPVIAASPSGAQVPGDALYFARVTFVHKQRYIGLRATVAEQRAIFSASAFLLSYDTRNNTTPSVVV